jgi:hypothetical protein
MCQNMNKTWLYPADPHSIDGRFYSILLFSCLDRHLRYFSAASYQKDAIVLCQQQQQTTERPQHWCVSLLEKCCMSCGRESFFFQLLKESNVLTQITSQ